MIDLDAFLWVLLIGSSIAVGIDAKNLGAGRHKLGGMADTSALMWGLGTFLLWIVVLPLYLITRPKLIAANQPAQTPTRRCAVCDQIYDAAYDGCPFCARAGAPQP